MSETTRVLPHGVQGPLIRLLHLAVIDHSILVASKASAQCAYRRTKTPW